MVVMQRLTAVLVAAILLALPPFITPPNLAYASTELSADAPVAVRDSGEPTDRQPELYQGSFLDTSTAAMLDRIGVTIFPEDLVFAFPDPMLGIGSQIKVFRALPVIIREGSSTQLVRTWKHTVAELLEEQQISLGSKDTTNLSLDAILPTQSTAIELVITRVSERTITLTSAIEFLTTYVDDATLEKGKTAVQTEGQMGTLATSYLLRFEDGVETSRTQVNKVITKKPVAKVIRRGTKLKATYLTSGQYKAFFNEATDMFGVPGDKLNTLMGCESGGNVNAVNSNLYFGLFQFDLQTWKSTKYGSASIFDARSQILAAASLWSQRRTRWPACVVKHSL